MTQFVNHIWLTRHETMACIIITQSKVQGLFVMFAHVGSSDPVRVLHLFHIEYTGYN